MVTRIQHGSSELLIAAQVANGTIGQDPATEAPSTRVHTGAVRFTAGDTEAHNPGEVVRHTMSFAGSVGGSVAATLQNVNGKQTVELEPGNPATRTLVSTAQRDGLVRRNDSGTWEDIATPQQPLGAQQAPTEAPQEQQGPELSPEDAEVFDPATETQWNQDIGPLPQGAYDSAVASTIGLLVNGGNVESTARNLAEASGMEPAEAMQYLDAGYSFYGNQVISAMAQQGITGDRFDAFLAGLESRQGQYQDAIQKLVYQKDLSGFKSAAAEFNRHNKSPERVMMAEKGFQTASDPVTGQTLYRLGTGQWVTMAQLTAGK